MRVSVTAQDYLYFVDRALDGMLAIATELGDERCCRRPNLPGANSAYGLITHCLGVVEYWGGQLVAGREVVRDRQAEFSATGTVAQLQQRAAAVRAAFSHDVATSTSQNQLKKQPDSWSLGPDRELDQGAALLHLYEELAQHHGQLEVLRDAALAEITTTGHSPSYPLPVEGFAAPMPWLRAKHGVKWHRPSGDRIPAWVADMDFPVAAPVRQAIEAALDRGDLGYPDWPSHPLAEPFAERMANRYGWQPDPGQVRGITDLIQALQITLQLASRPGQAVVAQVPNYPPFLATIAGMHRQLLPVQLTRTDASWTWDHQRLQTELATTDAAVLLLANPHNPTGRAFTRAELEQLAELAIEHDLIVISDEIHAELVHSPHRHIPFASLGPEVARRTVTVTSAGKAFNLAGLRTAVAHVGPDRLRRAWDAQPPDLFGATNVLGVEATKAAWRHGDAWLAQLQKELLDRRATVTRRLTELPDVRYLEPEASYLAWLDCAEWADPYERFRLAGVELSPGSDFGPGGPGHVRVNFATTDQVLNEILDRMAQAACI